MMPVPRRRARARLVAINEHSHLVVFNRAIGFVNPNNQRIATAVAADNNRGEDKNMRKGIGKNARRVAGENGCGTTVNFADGDIEHENGGLENIQPDHFLDHIAARDDVKTSIIKIMTR